MWNNSTCSCTIGQYIIEYITENVNEILFIVTVTILIIVQDIFLSLFWWELGGEYCTRGCVWVH